MPVNDESAILSDVEIILPIEIIETCRTLKPDALSCFMSVNEERQTKSKLSVHKLSDNSVRIRVTVMVLGASCQTVNDIQLANFKEAKAVDGDLVSVSKDTDSNATKIKDTTEARHERVSFKRKLKPCISNPIDANRLNKKLTSIWGSKRKRVFKRLYPSSLAALRPQANATHRMSTSSRKTFPGGLELDLDRTDVRTSSNGPVCASKEFVAGNFAECVSTEGTSVIINASAIGSMGDVESAESQDMEELSGISLTPGSSTVIILKTVSKPQSSETKMTPESLKTTNATTPTLTVSSEPRVYPLKTNAEEGNGNDRPKVTSRNIAERLEARARKGPQQVSCELCGEIVDGYSSLYRHVKHQHDDCTFVRNYLEEIEPMACTPCPVCKKLFATPTSLDTHIANAHPENRKSPAPAISKLSIQRHHIAAEKRRAPTPPSPDSSSDEEDEQAGPIVCKVCGKQCEDIVKYRRHSLTHGELRFPCEQCDKRFRMKDNLMKHVRRVHGKTTPETSEHGSGFKQASLGIKTPTSSAKSSLFKCDHCRATFNRTSLLVTHMRYCLKQKK